MAPDIRHLDDTTFDEALAASATPILVDFTADWCPPCRMIAPILDELAAERSGRLAVAKVDVDAQPGLAVRYGVQSLPTLLLFVDGEPAARIIGARPKAQLVRELDEVLVDPPAGR